MTALDTTPNVRPCGAWSLAPEDNCASTQPHSLAQAVNAAARAVDERSLAPATRSQAPLAFQPRSLLALLTFCYARQVYGSVEVEARLRRDLSLRQLCRNEIPDARTLRRFCSENREALEGCLKIALRFLAEQKVAQGILSRVNETHLAEEAGRRIVMAMFTDSMELDKDRPAEARMEISYLVA